MEVRVGDSGVWVLEIVVCGLRVDGGDEWRIVGWL